MSGEANEVLPLVLQPLTTLNGKRNGNARGTQEVTTAYHILLYTTSYKSQARDSPRTGRLSRSRRAPRPDETDGARGDGTRPQSYWDGTRGETLFDDVRLRFQTFDKSFIILSRV